MYMVLGKLANEIRTYIEPTWSPVPTSVRLINQVRREIFFTFLIGMDYMIRNLNLISAP